MSDFDEKKRSAAQTFGNIVRLSSASSHLDPQQLMVVMTQLLTPLAEGQALDLAPLEQFLREEKRLSASDIEEIFIFFQSREDKLGFPVKLPQTMANVSDARRARILDQFQKTPQTTTYSGSGPNKEPTGGTPAQKPGTMFDKKRPPPGAGVNRNLLMILLVALAGGGGYLAFSAGTAGPPLVEMDPLSDPAGLPCKVLVARGEWAFCDVPGATLDKLTPAELKKKGSATLKALEPRGVKELVTRKAEDGKPVPWR